MVILQRPGGRATLPVSLTRALVVLALAAPKRRHGLLILPYLPALHRLATCSGLISAHTYAAKTLAASRIAFAVLPTHSCARPGSLSNVMLSVIPGNVTGAYPVSLPGANIVF